jgi:hypothetical protein
MVERWLLPSIIPIVNSISINLMLPRGVRKLNSCLIVAPRGSGKTELLEHILAASNPEHFVVLPPKIFESELVKKGREYFHNRIMVRDDLIPTFEGTSTKQRQQFVNLWTMLLEGNYGRDRDVQKCYICVTGSRSLGCLRCQAQRSSYWRAWFWFCSCCLVDRMRLPRSWTRNRKSSQERLT